jgi:membrane protein DedA with SNARE-associated domain
MWEALSGALLRFIHEWDEVAVFLVFLLEEVGVPLPLPGDLVLIWAGYRVAAGQANFVVIVLLVEVAAVAGASVLYWLGLRGGRPLIVRYGRLIHVDERRLARAEDWMGRNATAAIILGRIVPGFRISTPLVSGVFHVPYRRFLPAVAAGSLIYATFWTTVGVYVGPSAAAALHAPQVTAHLLVSTILLVVVMLLTWRLHRRVLPGWRELAREVGAARRVEVAALAGLLATVGASIAAGSLAIALGELRIESPERALLETLALGGSGRGLVLGNVFVSVPGILLLVGGILWAIPYALWVEPRLAGPDWLRGATYSLLPALVSLFVVLPLLGAGPLGLGLQTGVIPATGEVVRHLVFGAVLGLAYPMFLLAQLPPHVRIGAGQLIPVSAD